MRTERAPLLPGHSEYHWSPRRSHTWGKPSNKQWCSSLGAGGRVCTPWDTLLPSSRAARVGKSISKCWEWRTALTHCPVPFFPPLFRTQFTELMESTRSVSAYLAVGNGSGLTAFPSTTSPPPNHSTALFVFLANLFSTVSSYEGFAHISWCHHNISALHWSVDYYPNSQFLWLVKSKTSPFSGESLKCNRISVKYNWRSGMQPWSLYLTQVISCPFLSWALPLPWHSHSLLSEENWNCLNPLKIEKPILLQD